MATQLRVKSQLHPARRHPRREHPGLSVTIDVAEKIVAPEGMSIQLNVHSPKVSNCNWQQYMFRLPVKASDTQAVQWAMENWPRTDAILWSEVQHHGAACRTGTGPDDCSGPLISPQAAFASFKGTRNDVIPAGAQLRIELLEDPDGKIIGAMFTVIDADGTKTETTQKILKSPFFGTSTLATPDILEPNMGFQLEIVALSKKAHATLTGSGTITYNAKNALQAVGDFPKAKQTGETSNMVYGEMIRAPRSRLTQKFGVDLTWPPAAGAAPIQPNCSGVEVYNPKTGTCQPPSGTLKDKPTG
ncbi:MAG TPA: hypothetical protein VGL66_11610 [Caulobacteraceae bacterium]